VFEYAQGLPDDETPQLMGLHANANITQAIYESSEIFHSILKLTAGDVQQTQKKASKEGNQDETQDASTSQAKNLIKNVRESIGQPFKVKEVAKRFPFRYEESMNAVLI